MRIIAGEKRSRKLVAPDGMETRPTADRAKEALFSILMQRLPGARVLDLYAGSGALALEALSRGAASAVLADMSPKACRAIAENIAALDYQDRARLLRCPDTAAMAQLRREGAAFDLIFLDPPYRMDTSRICDALAEALLAPGGVLIVEHARETPPAPGAALRLADRREYGVAGISFYRHAGEENV